jgi:hypothetical protein
MTGGSLGLGPTRGLNLSFGLRQYLREVTSIVALLPSTFMLQEFDPSIIYLIAPAALSSFFLVLALTSFHSVSWPLHGLQRCQD